MSMVATIVHELLDFKMVMVQEWMPNSVSWTPIQYGWKFLLLFKPYWGNRKGNTCDGLFFIKKAFAHVNEARDVRNSPGAMT